MHVLAVIAVAAALALATMAEGQLPSSDAFTIVPGVRFGPIRESTTRSSLPSLFPQGAIQDGDVYIGEGFCVNGTRVFPGTRDEIEVAWRDASRSRVAFVRTRMPEGRWVTPLGVRVGSLLTDLERIAGRVLTFSGFGWDYGGGMAWAEPSGSLSVRLAIDPADLEKSSTAADRDSIVGDRPVRSDHPHVRSLRIRVGQITQSWSSSLDDRECL